VTSTVVVVTLAFLLLGAVGWVISQQVGALVSRMPRYKGEIVNKLQGLQKGYGEVGVIGNIRNLVNIVAGELVKSKPDEDEKGGDNNDTEGKGIKADEKPKPGESPKNPLYVSQAPNDMSRLLEVAGPAGEGLATTFLVIVLTIFMVIQRENLRNRVVRLVGHGRLIVTTRALDEGARRISSYLIMMVLVNTSFGLILAVGLFVFGAYTGQESLRYTAVLWGFIAGSLRFVPYLGTWVAAALLALFSVATLPGWGPPLGVFIFFLVLELVTANVVEPLLFGHSTGSSPLALLLAAAFWTWLWGPVGLILSTPLTVSLVVLGKYVPQLRFFEVLLGDDPALSAEITFYQRLVARDQDEASELVEDFLESHSVEATYEELLLPALLLAKRDHERGELDDDDLEFVLQATRDLIEDLPTLQPEPVPGKTAGREGAGNAVLIGCPARDESDELALHLLAQLLHGQGYHTEVISSKVLTAEVLARVGNACPAVVCIGSLPPGGLAQARYLCKRMRVQCPTVKVVVGRWGETENVERIEKRLRAAGADYVGTTLLQTRSQVVPLLQVAAAAPPAAPTGEKGELVHSG
jgi:predicted PurR-regulated permease PerM